MSRTLSYSEISTALDCWAKWDMRYGDQLAGSSLKEREVVPILSSGSAWGAAVAAWHTTADQLLAGQAAIDAMNLSLDADAERQKEFGTFDQDVFDQARTELLQMLLHYIELADPVLMDPVVEKELLVAIPSRTGVRSSSRYKLQCFLDATETTPDGAVWIDEFKLRGRLTDVKLIIRSPQIRMYAWAYWQQTGVKPAGVYVNERLREVPKQPRVLASGKLSHAKNQMCSLSSYLAACGEHDDEPKPETADYLGARRWQQRVPVVFREGELEDVGRGLVSAAKLISQLENGALLPLRNAHRANCSGCPFRDVCDEPDSPAVDALFDRRPAKRNRQGAAP